MEAPQDDAQMVVADQDDQPVVNSDFELPFPVATVHELGQRAYMNQDNQAEWLWVRAHERIKLKMEPWRYLHSTKKSMEQTFRDLEVDFGEFKYRGRGQSDQKWQDSTFLSRGFLVCLLHVLKGRALKPLAKLEATKLLLGLVKMSFDFICQCHARGPQIIGSVINKSGKLVAEALGFDSFGFCRSWAGLMGHSKCGAKIWEELRKKVWNGRCISSSLDQASIEDIWFFLAFIACHPKMKEDGQVAWLVIGKVLLPPFIQLVGTWLDGWAFQLSQLELKELPLLKSRYGNAAKQLDPVNRMLILFKIRREKVHRRRVGLSHEGLVPLQGPWSRFEHSLDTVQHWEALQSAFSDHPQQLSCCWDPASYSGGRSTFVGVFFSPHLGKGGYMMNQQVAKLMQSEVSEVILEQSRTSKLARVEGFNELRGLCSALLHSTGLKLEGFQVPPGFTLRPVKPGEVRVKGKDGRYYFYDMKTKIAIPELPVNCNLSAIPVFVSLSDQGPNNVAALSYLQFSPEAIMVNCQWDCFHRSWNDIKNSCKKSSFKA